MTIKELPLDIRPRERLLNSGALSLSDVELLAIILGSGTKNKTSLQLSQNILSEFGSIGILSKATFSELSGIKGIGEAKAAAILASIELGKRLIIASKQKEKEKIVISSPEDAVNILIPDMIYLDKEYFKAIILNTKNEIIKICDISIGSLNSSIVHPRELFKMAMKHNGASVIVAHNHPSGNSTPSPEDINLTKRLSKAGEILGIELIDHIILGKGNFVSLKEENLL
ncbi:MAG: DNA repair protein RadC [Actinobacteria bacterium]|nr:DNA repair protein RadC [Actinomycetota bacterium]